MDPLDLDDGTTYLKFNPRRGQESVLSDYMPRANIVDLDEEDQVYKSSASRDIMPAYGSKQRYEPPVMNSSMDYFFGRQDFR